MPASFFLGLVTYPGTRFPDAATEAGLIRSLDRELRGRGASTTLAIEDRDRFDPVSMPVTRQDVVESIKAELDLEVAWRTFLDPDVSRARLATERSVRQLVRTLRLAPPWRTHPAPDDAGPRMVRRLANIETSHLALMEQAMASGAQWALILEDDAQVADPAIFAGELISFAERYGEESQPLYVNLSRSFELRTLRIEHLMRHVGSWSDDGTVELLASSRPVTNTVCAVLYRGAFLRELAAIIQSIPLHPVVPIDWKLNHALMELTARTRIRDADCWTASPAPVIQGSMAEFVHEGVH